MEEKNEEVLEYLAVEVPTQHVAAIQTPEKELMTIEQGIAKILNMIVDINKKL